MLTVWSGNKRGNPTMGKYKFQSLWEIDTLAAVNARDVGRKYLQGYESNSVVCWTVFKFVCYA